MHKDISYLNKNDKNFIQIVENFIQDWYSNKHYIEVKTSGSTGKPKKIKIDKNKIIQSAKMTGEYFKFKENQTLLLCLSPDYIAGKMMIVRALVYKMKIIVASPSSNPLLIENLNKKIDFGAFIPMQVREILKNQKSKLNYTKIKNVIIGGAPTPLLLEKELQKLPNQTYATFGMTETISHIALKNISKTEPFYQVLPDIKISTTNEDCLVIEAPKLLDKKLITNDIIEILDDKKFIWRGRKDFVINSGGIKIFPEELEKKVETLIQERRFFLNGEKNAKFGEILVLYIEGEKFSEKKLDVLNDHFNTIFESFMKPKKIYFYPQFEETETGKIIKKSYV